MLFPLDEFCLDTHSPARSNLWFRASRRLFFSVASLWCLSLQNIRFMAVCAFNFNPLTFEEAFFGLICEIRLAEPSGGPPVGLIFAPGVAKTPL